MPQQQEQPQDMSMGQNTAQDNGNLSTGMPLSNDALGQPGANGMSSDDLASTLGFITTLSQHMFHGEPEKPQEAPKDTPSEPKPKEEPKDDTPPEDPKEEQRHDDEQDKEIENIKTELEKLLQEENGKETKDTTTTE